MTIKTFDAEITPTGEVLVDIKGYTDSSCDALAQLLVGKNTVITETKKPEYLARISNLVKK